MATLENIARHLTKVYEPLVQQIETGNVRPLLSELGVEFPDTLDAQAGVQTAFTTAKTRVQSAVTKLAELETEIEGGDELNILVKGAELISAIVQVVDGVKGIADALNAAKGSFPPIAASIADLATHLPERMFNLLLSRYLSQWRMLPEMLELVDLIKRVETPIAGDLGDALGDINAVRTALQFDRIGRLLTEPKKLLEDLYDWGKPGFDGKKLLKRLDEIMHISDSVVFFDELGSPPKLDIFFAEISTAPASTHSPIPGVLIKLKTGVKTGDLPPIEGRFWKVEVKFDVPMPVDTELYIWPNGSVAIKPPFNLGPTGGNMSVTWTAKHSDGADSSPFVILGQAGGTRLEVGSFFVKKVVEMSWTGTEMVGKFRLEAGLENGKVALNPSGGDGFLSSILPATNMEATFGATIGVSSERGVYFAGSSALEIKLPTHVQIAAIELQALIIALRLKQSGQIEVGLGGDIKTTLGPLTAVVSNMGLKAIFTFPPGGGNLGPLQLDLGFQAPEGVGLSIDAGGFKGGGFLYFKPDIGEYGGALEFDFNRMLVLKAVGIINTKMPDGSSGFALLILITAEFTPIQLGFGFTLNGVGGLFALNRTVRMSALQEGVRTNAIKSILFPDDVVSNITRIISDIKQFFPIEPDHFIIGPMVKFGWGTPSIITGELGLILNLPDPVFAIVGVIKMVLPDERAPLLKIQVNFIGIFDFKEGYIFFRADLYDSRLLVFTLTGSLAFLISWGSQETFAVSIGGFHPDFRDIPTIPALPDGFRNMQRIGIRLLSSDNPRLLVETYFAVTSNSVQFGARAEFYAEAGPFNAYGFLGFDVLFQFDPFRFIVSFEAGFALRIGTSNIMGITVRGKLAGPTPWEVDGEASVTVFPFVEISVHVHVTWGDPPPSIPAAQEDLLDVLRKDFNDVRNWRAEIPANNFLHVSLRELNKDAAELIVHPFGVLTFSQRSLPLGLEIQKYGVKKPKADKLFSFEKARVGTISFDENGGTDYQNVKESFATGNFRELDDNQKLSTPSYEKQRSGFRLQGTAATLTGSQVERDVTYELTYVQRDNPLADGLRMILKIGTIIYSRLTGGSAIRSSAMSKQNAKDSLNAPLKPVIRENQYALASTTDLSVLDAKYIVSSQAEAMQAMSQLLYEKPEMIGQVQVVAMHEAEF